MDRRRDDERLTRLEAKLNENTVRLAEHMASCGELNKTADQRHEENIGRMDTMNGKLDQLLDAHKVQKAMRRLATVGWGAAVTVAAGAGWVFDHWR